MTKMSPLGTASAAHTPWLKLLLSVGAVFLLFDRTAAALHSDRGQAGLVVASLVVLAAVGAEVLLFRQSPGKAIVALGLGRPKALGMLAAAGVCAALLVVIPIFGRASDARIVLDPDWLWLLPGLFAQGGLAEETLFRGYLFRRVRQGRSFWSAALAAMLPFAAVHLLLFFSMAWPIAVAALLLAVVMSLPLAYLFELGGQTIWAPAAVHFVAQGAIKVVVAPEDQMTTLALTWMAASAVLPLAVFLVQPGRLGALHPHD